MSRRSQSDLSTASRIGWLSGRLDMDQVISVTGWVIKSWTEMIGRAGHVRKCKGIADPRV